MGEPVKKDGFRAALITGGRGVGKTTVCDKIIAETQAINGILSLAVFNEKGIKIGENAYCITEQNEWPLGKRRKLAGRDRIRSENSSRKGINDVYRGYVVLAVSFVSTLS